MEKQKHKILSMDFGTGYERGFNQLNIFLSERASERYSALDTQESAGKKGLEKTALVA